MGASGTSTAAARTPTFPNREPPIGCQNSNETCGAIERIFSCSRGMVGSCSQFGHARPKMSVGLDEGSENSCLSRRGQTQWRVWSRLRRGLDFSEDGWAGVRGAKAPRSLRVGRDIPPFARERRRMGQRLLLGQGCFPTLSQKAAKGWGNGSWLWGRGFERGLAADLVSWKIGGAGVRGAKASRFLRLGPGPGGAGAEGAGAFRPLKRAGREAAFRPGLHRPVADLIMQVERHRVQRSMGGGAERITLRGRNEPSANGILLDVLQAGYEFGFGHGLAFIEAAHPDVHFALQAERETAFDELHSLFKRYIGSGCDQRVEVIGHDDECVQEEFSLAAVVEDGLLK